MMFAIAIFGFGLICYKFGQGGGEVVRDCKTVRFQFSAG